MRKEIRNTFFIFSFGFFALLLSEKFIGYGKTYGKALQWDKVYENIPEYLIFSALMALLFYYSVRKKDSAE